MVQVHRRKSLYFQLLLLLLCAALLSGLLFGCMNVLGERLIDQWYLDSDYMEKKNETYVRSLQEYVSEHQLNITDTKEITRWVKSQKMINIELYQNDVLYYDSQYPNKQDLWEENVTAAYYDWSDYYIISFEDGEAYANIYGLYDYQIYNYAIFAELLLSFLVFLAIVIGGIRSKVNYIMKLSEEIEILEGGNLDYEITVKGADELSLLAGGLNGMRKSFREQVKQEAELVQENQRVITEMSHDLRTPVTSMMLYLTILKKGALTDEKQMQEYLQKVENKAEQMKQLTDHLFEYSLVTEQTRIEKGPPEKMEAVFYDLFSEMCSYLEQKGFHVNADLQWPDVKLEICMDYVMRILDNLTSNLVKYADPQKEVHLAMQQREGYAGFSLENGIFFTEQKAESTGIGIHSIRNMMKSMDGICETKQTEESFGIQLLFPIDL